MLRRYVVGLVLCLSTVCAGGSAWAQAVDITTVAGLDDLLVEAAESPITVPAGTYYIPHTGIDNTTGQPLTIEEGGSLHLSTGVTVQTTNEFRQIFPDSLTALTSSTVLSDGGTSDGVCFIRCQGTLTADSGVEFDRVPVVFESLSAPGSAGGTLDGCIFVESPVGIIQSSPSLRDTVFSVTSYDYEVNTPIFLDNLGQNCNPDLTGADISACTTQAIGVGNLLSYESRSSEDDCYVDSTFEVLRFPAVFGDITEYLLQGSLHVMPQGSLSFASSGTETVRIRSVQRVDGLVNPIVVDGTLDADGAEFGYLGIFFQPLSGGTIDNCTFIEAPITISSAAPSITNSSFHITEYVSEANFPIFLSDLGQGTDGMVILDNDFSASTVQGIGTGGTADSSATLPVTVSSLDDISLYVLVADAVVLPNVTLTVEPGVMITADPSDTTPESLEIRGSMTATNVTFNYVPLTCSPGSTVTIEADDLEPGDSILNESSMSIDASTVAVTGTLVNNVSSYAFALANLGEGSALTLSDNEYTTGTKRSVATYGVVNGSATLPYVESLSAYTLVEFYKGEQVETAINFGGTLTIEPGATLTTEVGSQAEMLVNGTLIVEGSDTDTSGTVDPDEAVSLLRVPIAFNPLSAGSFAYAKLVGSPVRMDYSSPSFANCVFATQGITAIMADNSSAVTADASDFIGSIGTGAGIRNIDGDTLIDATDCFWGAPDGPSGNGDGTGVAVFGVDTDDDGDIDNIDFEPFAADFINVDLVDYFDDADGDGLPTLIEDVNGDGVVNPGETDPNVDDTDNDGVVDGRDAFPLDPEEQYDRDSDGIGNNTDDDDDGDGVLDVFDTFPLDPNEDTDTDGDGIGDNSDDDIDGDGIPNDTDINPYEPDLGTTDPSIISTNITEDRTLTVADSPYTVYGEVEILSEAVLTVQPGVVIRAFNSFGSTENVLLVNAGELNIEGATLENLPVTFGLAGSGSIIDSTLLESPVIIDQCSPTITGNTFIVTSYGGTIITPITLVNGGQAADPVIAGNDFSQSTAQAVGTSGSVSQDATLALYDDLSYVLLGDLSVGAGATLTVEDGVRVTIAQDGEPHVMRIDGTLAATSSGSPRTTFEYVSITLSALSSAVIDGCTFTESPITIQSAAVDIQNCSMQVTETVSGVPYPVFVDDLGQGCTLVLADNDFTASTLPGIGTGGIADSNATLPVTTPALQDTSLYILTEDSQVSPGVVLTLESGVQLVEDPTSSGPEKLTVYGTLNGDGVMLRNISLEFGPGSDGTLQNSTIIETPIDIEAASPTITACTIESLNVLPFILKKLGEGSSPTITGIELIGESPRVIGTYGTVNGTATLPYIPGFSYTLLRFDRGEQAISTVRYGGSLTIDNGVVLAASFENSVLGAEGADPDTDGDGTPNSRDLDDDNDGVLDSEDPLPLDPGSGIGDSAGRRGITVEGSLILDGVALGRTGLFFEPMSQGTVTDTKLVGSRIELDYASSLSISSSAIVPQGVIGVTATSRSTVAVGTCDIFPRGVGVLNNDAFVQIDAENNYWGDESGPSGDGGGLGTGVFGNVDFTPFSETFINIALIAPAVDSDDDGLPDSVEDLNGNGVTDPGETSAENRDTDGDGTTDGSDPFPLDETEWRDTDNDGVGDNTDNDDDNDGYLDSEDDLPLDPTEWMDTDGDGIGNNADPDDDDDGILDGDDPNPLVPDETGGAEGDPSILFGTITEDRTLYPLPDDQPYTVMGQVRVNSGVTLTLSAGVTVETLNSFGEVTNRLVVANGGTLLAEDSATFDNVPIYFEPLSEGTITDSTLRDSFVVLSKSSPTITGNLFDFVSFGSTVNVPIMMENVGEGCSPTVSGNTFARDATVAIGLRGSTADLVTLTLYDDISRYLLFEDVSVMPGGLLTVEEGVTLSSAGDETFSLLVEGTLIAQGSGKASDVDLSDNIVFDDAPVVFLPVSTGTLYRSVFIDSPITLSAASPEISECFFSLDAAGEVTSDSFPIFVSNLGQGCDPQVTGNEFSVATYTQIGTAGTATTDAMLSGTSDLSTYVLVEPSTVARGATLTIGPGVQMRGLDLEGDGLFVEGELDVGEDGSLPVEITLLPIRFEPFSGGLVTNCIFRTSRITVDFASPEFSECIFNGTGSFTAVYVENDGTPTINDCDFAGVMSYGIRCSNTGAMVNAEYNWWDAASGPSYAGPGSGVSVTTGVDYSPWLGEPRSSLLVDDFDGDYLVDFYDDDDDQDGTPDDIDPMPFDTDNDGSNNDVDADDDNDGIDDGVDIFPLDTDNDGIPNAYDSDDDNDGLSDDMEILFGTNMLVADSDGDGLSDLGEFEAGTDPAKTDTDGDGLADGMDDGPLTTDTDGDGLDDGDEVLVYGTNPVRADTDGDGLNDADELFIHDTDPLLRDTDGGGDGDGTEVYRGTNPLDAGDDTGEDADGDGLTDLDELVLQTDPNNSDTDGDGLDDGQEVSLGTDPLVQDTDDDGLDDAREVLELQTDPLLPDTDGDGLTDLQEVSTVGSNPNLADTDGDGLDDAEEVALRTSPVLRDTDGGGNDDGTEIAFDLDPLDPADDFALDTDGDGLSDFDEFDRGTDHEDTDTDDDGLDDGEEIGLGTNPLSLDTDGDGLTDANEVRNIHTDPTVADTDGDGLTDGEEVLTYVTDPLLADTDGDGLTDAEELALGTNAHDTDTDNDDVTDGEEVAAGSDPFDPEDVPVSEPDLTLVIGDVTCPLLLTTGVPIDIVTDEVAPVSLRVDILYDENVVTPAGIDPGTAALVAGCDPHMAVVTPGQARLTVPAGTSAIGDGLLATMYFRVLPNQTAGTVVALVGADRLAYSADLTELAVDVVGGSIELEPDAADIDGNGTVDAIDLQRAINQVLGLGAGTGDAEADVNGDGYVDSLDLQILINRVLGVE